MSEQLALSSTPYEAPPEGFADPVLEGELLPAEVPALTQEASADAFANNSQAAPNQAQAEWHFGAPEDVVATNEVVEGEVVDASVGPQSTPTEAVRSTYETAAPLLIDAGKLATLAVKTYIDTRRIRTTIGQPEIRPAATLPEAPKFEQPQEPKTAEAAPQPANAERNRTPEELRTALMERIANITDGKEDLEKKGYQNASLAELEYAARIGASKRYYDGVKTVPPLDMLRKDIEQNDELEKMGITDFSIDAINERVKQDEEYQTLLQDLYTEATEHYTDDELRAAGYDWANGDELNSLIKATQANNGPIRLPDLNAYRQQMRNWQRDNNVQENYAAYLEARDQIRREHGTRLGEKAPDGYVRARRNVGDTALVGASA